MPTGKHFDLMKEKPVLDIPTLNYVWDWLWRRDYCAKITNVPKRAEQGERHSIMQLLQDMADRETSAE